MQDYWTINQTATEWNMRYQSVILFIKRGRVPGAVKFGRQWAIPAGTARPADLRFRGARAEREQQADTPLPMSAL